MNEYIIEGLKCSGCANTVKERFENVSGVESVEINLDKKTATVTGNYNEADLKASLNDTNYSVA